MQRFERIDNTAPVTDVSKNIDADVKYSNFDLSNKKIGQALPYAIIPIDYINTVPNTTVWLNYDVQITFRNPTMRKMLNGWRVYLHTYYNRNSDLWEGWNNFITKGRRGDMGNMKIPHIQTRIPGKNGAKWTPFTPMSLYDYLEYAPEDCIKSAKTVGGETTYYEDFTKNVVGRLAQLTTTDGETDSPNTHTSTQLADYTNIEINALKAMMYQRLWRDKYSNKNLLQSNTKLFPANEEHFILSYNADCVGKIDYENEKITALADNTPNNADNYIGIDNSNPGDMDIRLDCLRFRQFMGDRFTSASPFNEMIRGNIPGMELHFEDLDLEIPARWIGDDPDVGKGALYYRNNASYSISGNQTITIKNIADIGSGEKSALAGQIGSATAGTLAVHLPKQEINVPLSEVASTISLSDLRSLEVFTIFAERMGRTNGDYNEMIQSQFNHNPRLSDREAIYIGGSFQDIISNSIYQTSETTAGSETQLGSQVAQGISASYNKIGEFTADDYGIIMTVMCIVPETIYVNGIDRKETALTMEEQYFPIMNNLSAEAILNRELYVSGTEATDTDAWGWAERFSEYKSRQNKVCGLSQLGNLSVYDSNLVMARRFNTTPELNASFVTGVPENYELNTFASADEAPFDFAIRSDCNVRYPMPYVTIPGGLSTRA